MTLLSLASVQIHWQQELLSKSLAKQTQHAEQKFNLCVCVIMCLVWCIYVGNILCCDVVRADRWRCTGRQQWPIDCHSPSTSRQANLLQS